MAQPLRLADRLETEASKLRFARVLLVVISAPFYAIAWVVSTVVKVIWSVFAWVVTAVKVGWQDAWR
jgi:hypothetical protein